MTVRKTIALALGLTLLAAATEVWATGGIASPGLLINIVVESSGVVLFNTTGTHTGQPTCATSGRFAFNGTTAAGQATEALVLTAYGLGKQVSVYGTGACDVWGDSETVLYVFSP